MSTPIAAQPGHNASPGHLYPANTSSQAPPTALTAHMTLPMQSFPSDYARQAEILTHTLQETHSALKYPNISATLAP